MPSDTKQTSPGRVLLRGRIPGRRRPPPDVHTGPKAPIAASEKVRIVSRGREAEQGLLRVGLRTRWSEDMYHRALTMRWRSFLLVAAMVYLGANVTFALLYMLQPGSIANAHPGSFLDAFFFSVQTFGTIGYGAMLPATVYANTLMTAETLVGIMLVAMTTGLMFARVSRPTARVLFAQVAVVVPYNGVPTLMVRMGNQRRNQILQAEVTMTLVRNEGTLEGGSMRRFYDLKLARGHTPIFAMSFTAMHPMDAASPLAGATRATLEDCAAELLVTVTGLDETMSQTVHARISYLPHEVMFGHRYADVFGLTDDGRRAIDYRLFHTTEKIEDAAPG